MRMRMRVLHLHLYPGSSAHMGVLLSIITLGSSQLLKISTLTKYIYEGIKQLLFPRSFHAPTTTTTTTTTTTPEVYS